MMNDMTYDNLIQDDWDSGEQDQSSRAKIDADLENQCFQEERYNEKEEEYGAIVDQMTDKVSNIFYVIFILLIISAITTMWLNTSWILFLLTGALLWQGIFWIIIRWPERSYDNRSKKLWKYISRVLRNLIWTEGTYNERISDNIALREEDREEIRKIDASIKIRLKK